VGSLEFLQYSCEDLEILFKPVKLRFYSKILRNRVLQRVQLGPTTTTMILTGMTLEATSIMRISLVSICYTIYRYCTFNPMLNAKEEGRIAVS